MAKPTHRIIGDPTKDPWNAATEKLLAMTESGQVTWSPVHEFGRSRSETEVARPAFTAEVAGRHILVYEYSYKHYLDADDWVWDRDVSIEFVSPEPEFAPQWTWPSPHDRFRLMEAIRYQYAKADEFLSKFLAGAAEA
jgi:hypothetical protein